MNSSENPLSLLLNGHYKERIRQTLDVDTWRKLSFLTSFLADGQLMDFPNIELEPGKPMAYRPVGPQLKESAVTWEDIPWIKKVWGDAPMIIKGVHTIEDARLAEKHGAAAIVISNHGGRQVDQTPATLHMLQEIAPILNEERSNLEILLDGGIRSGLDVLIAKAYGADAVLCGRGPTFGLGAGGPRGVSRFYEIMKEELEGCVRLLGKSEGPVGSVADINRNIIYDRKS
jgi:L-lactate dehydrogenase (cytochrome)